jgi:hypothetical protein
MLSFLRMKATKSKSKGKNAKPSVLVWCKLEKINDGDDSNSARNMVVNRLLTDRIVDRPDPEYHVILRIGSGSHSNFKFARNDQNVNPLEGPRSDPLRILYYQMGLDLLPILP